MKKALASEIQFLFRRVTTDSGIDPQSCHERADNVWQFDEIGELAGHRHDAKHRDKIGLRTIAQLCSGSEGIGLMLPVASGMLPGAG